LEHENRVAWLKVVAKYKICEYIRYHGNFVCNNLEMKEPATEEDAFCWKEFQLLMEEVLSENERVRFIRYFLIGATDKELAEWENTTEGNVRVKLSRTKKKIRKSWCA